MKPIKFVIFLVIGAFSFACSVSADKKHEEIREIDNVLAKQLEEVGQDSLVIAFQNNREAIANTQHRPLYHFSAPLGRIHDPNGFCQWQGSYHLFYQYLDTDPNTEGIRWGHAYSKDLLHWKDLPVAIKPTVEKSSFSGQTLVEDDRVIAMWHGLKVGNMIATASDPLLLNWEMNPNNPVIPIDNKQGPYEVFDPCIWKQDDGYYYSLTGSYKNGEVGKDCVGEIHAFKSKDLSSWKWIGDMLTDSILSEPGEDMVVPNFWPISDDKHMLLCFSHKRAGRGYVGSYNPKTVKFTPDYHFRANHSVQANIKGGLRSINSSVHAPSATVDDKGRYIAFFNMCDYKEKDGWSGIMTLPRIYSLDDDNSLLVQPAKELENLRFNHATIKPFIITEEETRLKGVAGKAMEVLITVKPNEKGEFSLKVLQSDDGKEFTLIKFSNSEISLENHHPNKDRRLKLTPEVAPFSLTENEPLELRVFIDRCVVEVFVSNRECCSLRVYPKDKSARNVSVYSKGGNTELLSLNAWQMRSVWPELKFKERE